MIESGLRPHGSPVIRYILLAVCLFVLVVVGNAIQEYQTLNEERNALSKAMSLFDEGHLRQGLVHCSSAGPWKGSCYEQLAFSLNKIVEDDERVMLCNVMTTSHDLRWFYPRSWKLNYENELDSIKQDCYMT